MAIISITLRTNIINAAVLGDDYKISAKAEAEIKEAEKAAAEGAALCLKLMEEQSLAKEDVKYIGIGVSEGVGCPKAAAEEIEKAVGIKTVSAPLINALAMGEAYVNADDASSIAILCIDEKVNSCVMIDHKIYEGAGQGGDFAHMVIKNNGFKCECGRNGCFQAYVSKSGLRTIAEDCGVFDSEKATLKSIFDAADVGDFMASGAKTFFIEYMASGVTDIINLFQPHQLVIFGHVTELGDRLMRPMMDIVLKDQYTRNSPNKGVVRFAQPEDDVLLVGAALLGR